MRRKSERNKAKGSPEKKVEKPTRRTTRRRGKPSPSPSPERENPEDNTSNTPCSEDNRESAVDKQVKDTEEQQEKPVSSSDLIKSVLGGDEEDSGSVWKVARADASPGEIQKLKLCRQRNISEASDSSISKKKSNKWPDSGEGGVEEVDSVDEQIASSQNLPICENIDDPSSSHPGQDSNQEVSDYKENLPETTSANLSDDQTNIDQQADFKDNLPETTSAETLSQPPNYEDNQSSNLLIDNSYTIQTTDDNAKYVPENLSIIQQSEDSQEHSNDQACFSSNTILSEPPIDINVSVSNEPLTNIISGEENSEIHEGSLIEENKTVSDIATCNLETESLAVDEESVDTKLIRNENEQIEFEKETNSDNASDSRDKSDIQDNQVQSPRTKNPSKYDEPFASESSDDEQSISRNDETQEKEEGSLRVQNINNKRNNENQTVQSTDVDENSMSTNVEPEIELSESIIEKDDILEINEKSDDLNVTLSVSKPAKVSLKRSFTTRLPTDSEKKTEESNMTEDNQNKENHADNEQPDRKNSTKRRRWGVTTTTDVAPAFSISTDSLKALVPGAKPLSMNEVRLGKDEDEDKDRYKDKSEDVDGHKPKNDASSRNDTNRKGDDKMDNHIASRRKISIKETPRPTSPSPPEPQATKILLIKNLVRPFTLNQIKELLSRTGTIAENGFWMDRIKSKCFVEYANEDQAFETRQALHGVSWPPSNPKKLVVEYATKEDMEAARDSLKDQPVVRKAAEPMLSTESWQQDQWSREDRSTVINKITVIREWDLGKEDGHLSLKEKERERKELEKKKRQRSRSPLLEAHLPPPARKFKKKEEEPPTAKLLDDLFRKTRSTPCIYWLPLTNEQIMVKEEMRRQHMAEHARRLEEMRRAERSRDSRRRRSPRK
ncbi:apoptotic chromatin condensation inducer in the nucleus [Phymastichus coffea]|uniref:apoptotic chromatin condensation inducer in the nucleus n=1 Tax=Phymastichus coffea TaxID=108790 RepID=UPI00273CA243|nr:apoptotic chromatin condensation inducer in the nucleus [Phymastichus coffea]